MKKTFFRNVFIGFLLLGAVGATVYLVNKSHKDKEVAAELAALEQAEQVKLQAFATFINSKKKEKGVKELGDGNYYKVLADGTGAVVPTPSTNCEVCYKMELPDGTKVDENACATFQASRLIPGARLALTKMRVGDEWEVYIPYEQGYGVQGSGKIPPYSALVFTIKLIAIK